MFCFVRVTLTAAAVASLGISTAAEGRRTFHDYALVRWLMAHGSVQRLGPQRRPVCPGLSVNHALWAYEAKERAHICSREIRDQLRDSGVNVARWDQEYGEAAFDLVPAGDVLHYMNIAPDPDTRAGLLETISFPGVQDAA